MNELIARYAPLLLQGLEETLYMTVFSTVLAYVFGLPLGVLVYVTKDGGIHPNRPLNRVLSWFINLIRSVPFLILGSLHSIPFPSSLPVLPSAPSPPSLPWW